MSNSDKRIHLNSHRKANLIDAMTRAGIGKAWRKKYKAMASEDARKFEEKVKTRAMLGDRQWNEAWERFTVLEVARTLRG